MAGHDIQETLKQLVDSCLSHSRELRSVSFRRNRTACTHVSPCLLLTYCNLPTCRAEALQNQHRAVRHMHLQSEASALEAEAATWELLLHMYADTRKMYPAGTGGQQTAIKTVSLHHLCQICLHGRSMELTSGHPSPSTLT